MCWRKNLETYRSTPIYFIIQSDSRSLSISIFFVLVLWALNATGDVKMMKWHLHTWWVTSQELRKSESLWPGLSMPGLCYGGRLYHYCSELKDTHFIFVIKPFLFLFLSSVILELKHSQHLVCGKTKKPYRRCKENWLPSISNTVDNNVN